MTVLARRKLPELHPGYLPAHLARGGDADRTRRGPARCSSARRFVRATDPSSSLGRHGRQLFLRRERLHHPPKGFKTPRRILMSLPQKLFAVLICICAPNLAYSQPWNQFTLSGPASASTAGRIAAVSRSPNTMEVFWIGLNGTVQDAYLYEGDQWKGFTLAGPGSASTTGGIAAVSRSSNTMEVFWIGPNGAVQNAYFYEGAQWKGFTLAGPGSASTTGGIAAVSRSSNTIEVFWIGPNGTVQDAYFYEGDQWKGFTLAGPGSASPLSGIAAISRASYTMEVFWTGPKGTVQDAYFYEGDEWKGFTLAGPGSAAQTAGITALSRDPRCMAVWWIAPDGHVEDANWNDGSTFDGNPGCEPNSLKNQWYAWPLAPPGSASVTGGIAAVSRSSNTIELFWIAPDGRVQHAWWYPDPPWNQWPRSQLATGAAPSGRVAAVSRDFNTMELWWTGGDASVQDNYWYSPAWTGSYAHLTSLAQKYRWLVLKCTLSDDRTVPEHLDSLISNFLTEKGVGTGNISDYYSDVSYGAASLTGTVYGWYPAPFDGTEPGIAGPGNRPNSVQACVAAIPPSEAATIDFGAYWGVIMVVNHLMGAGACQSYAQIKGKSLPCVVLDPTSMFTAFAAHEIGHGLGMPHSFDNTCEYCDKWDLMSALKTYQFNSLNYPSAGPGLNVPNLLHMGWIPGNRIATYRTGDPATDFTLRALSHPLGNEPLAVRILAFPFVFTLEYRQKDGWDSGIPGNAVIVHVYMEGEMPYSFLFDGQTFNGAIRVGETMTAGNFRVRVNSIGRLGRTANITIGPVP